MIVVPLHFSASGPQAPDFGGVMYQTARHILDTYAIERARLSDRPSLIAFDRQHAEAAIDASDTIRLILEDRLNLARVSRSSNER